MMVNMKVELLMFILLQTLLLIDSIRLLPSKNHESCQRVCNICNLNFKRIAEYERHIKGKAHESMVKRNSITEDEIYIEFQSSAPNWQNPEIKPKDLIDLWDYNELGTLGFKYRENCLHPSPTIKNLTPIQRARMWRYIRDVMGVGYYTELAGILAAVDNDEFGHLRIKEVFESLESYKVIANFIIAATKTGNPPTSIVELACGHGLVGCLLAYRFHNLSVHLYDLHQRPTFDAFLRAFESRGCKRPNALQVLPNIVFHEKDISESVPFIKDSVVVCLHGCNEVNSMAVELAIENCASGWIVMPCCIRKEQYLGSSCQILIDDDQNRFSLLIGALALNYNAQEIRNIDKRITNRNILVAGGVYDKNDNDNNLDDENFKAFKRKRMPKLILS